MSEGPTRRGRVETSLAPLLRHFTGLYVIVELKNGRSYRGVLKSADHYMNLVLHRAAKNSSSSSSGSTINQEGNVCHHQCNVPFEREDNHSLKETLDPEEYELLHIRGPSIRYVHLPGDANLQALIKEGLNRERGALDKYRRGKRKIATPTAITTLVALTTTRSSSALSCISKGRFRVGTFTAITCPATFGRSTPGMSKSPFKRQRTSFYTNMIEGARNDAVLSNDDPSWNQNITICSKCRGEGKKRARRTKKENHRHRLAVESAIAAGLPEPSPPIRYESCKACSGTGLCSRDESSLSEAPSLPTIGPGVEVAIVGGGIGGFALALALQHRRIPCTVYERDRAFNERSQGYGLTMQQGAKALKSLGFHLVPSSRDGGIDEDRFGIHSKRHVVHKSDGTVVGEWGMRVWGRPDTKEQASRQNAHVPRQELRRLLMERIQPSTIQWGHSLLEYKTNEVEGNNNKGGLQLEFQKRDGGDNNENNTVRKFATILVGADGIRSAVRRQKIGDEVSPLKYLGCIVILGISKSPVSELTDGETVFQTADGTTRLYAMPFSSAGEETVVTSMDDENVTSADETCKNNRGETMWQLSFPMSEDDAMNLSQLGPSALKSEALVRCGSWHHPIPTLLKMTPDCLISGYPVYDRDLLSCDVLRDGTQAMLSNEDEHENGSVAKGEKSNMDSNSCHDHSLVTLIGDAAHPMSPFKGQGANQALLDAVSLARVIHKALSSKPGRGEDYEDNATRAEKIQQSLRLYEKDMVERSAPKVKASAEAAKFLHSEVAIMEGNFPRGTAAKEASSSQKT